MRKTIISLLIAMLMIGTISTTFANADYEEYEENSMNKTQLRSSTNIDEIDQHNGAFCGYGDCDEEMLAQSFKPTRNTLSKILIPLWKTGEPGTLKISIKSDLDGNDLTDITVNAGQIDSGYKWYTFDFKDIYFDVGQTYYIVWDPSDVDFENNYYWGFGDDNPYPNGYAWDYDVDEWHIHNGEGTMNDIDFCFSQYGYNTEMIPDLYCTGSLSWSSITPGSSVIGSFEVSNIGHSQSELNWRIESYPDWGTWTFSPSSGNHLSPSDGTVSVNVFVEIPDDTYEHFSGEVKIINIDDPSDSSTIPISLSTQKTRMFNTVSFRFFEKISNIFSFFRQLTFNLDICKPLQLQSDYCEIIYPNGGEELCDLCEVEWQIYSYYPPLPLLSRVIIGCESSDYIPATTGEGYKYSFNTRSIHDGSYKAKVILYLDSDEDGNPDCVIDEDESDSFFNIVNGPRIPEKPIGPVEGRPEVAYSYSTSTTHHANKMIKYKFSWGDGTDSGWLGPYLSGVTIAVNHSWETIGTYSIKVKAMDSAIKESQWSEALYMVITENPPLPPTIQGPSTGVPDIEYSYNISTFDPEGDSVYYLIDWYHDISSDWIGPYNSGETVCVSHIFPEKGSYSIKVKAKDEYGMESNWSDPFVISMPKNRENNQKEQVVLENFQHMQLLKFYRKT